MPEELTFDGGILGRSRPIDGEPKVTQEAPTQALVRGLDVSAA